MKYRKKPVVIEAFKLGYDEEPEWFSSSEYVHKKQTFTVIVDKQGYNYAVKGNYIIKGVGGEIYPCASHIFKETYEEVVE